jgi:hypothetical protein
MGETNNIDTMIKMTSSNYLIWKSRMDDILFCKDVYVPIIGTKWMDVTMWFGLLEIKRPLHWLNSGLMIRCFNWN